MKKIVFPDLYFQEFDFSVLKIWGFPHSGLCNNAKPRMFLP